MTCHMIQNCCIFRKTKAVYHFVQYIYIYIHMCVHVQYMYVMYVQVHLNKLEQSWKSSFISVIQLNL